MKTLIFTLLLNLPHGEQVTVYSDVMPEAACLSAQAAIWSIPSATVGQSVEGKVEALDAACLPMDDLAQAILNESE